MLPLRFSFVFLVNLPAFLNHPGWHDPLKTDVQHRPLRGEEFYPELCILPLGNSVTQAHVDHTSYRYPLWKKLVDLNESIYHRHFRITFTGSKISHFDGYDKQPDGTIREFPKYRGLSFPKRHEGHWGWTADEVQDKVKYNWMESWEDPWEGDKIRQSTTNIEAENIFRGCVPNCVLIHLGTNDVAMKQSNENVVGEIKQIIETMETWRYGKNAISQNQNRKYVMKFLLALPIPGCSREAVESLGVAFRQALNRTSSRFANENDVHLVDMQTCFQQEWLYDGCHPDSVGEDWMAERWLQAITEQCLDNGLFDGDTPSEEEQRRAPSSSTYSCTTTTTLPPSSTLRRTIKTTTTTTTRPPCETYYTLGPCSCPCSKEEEILIATCKHQVPHVKCEAEGDAMCTYCDHGLLHPDVKSCRTTAVCCTLTTVTGWSSQGSQRTHEGDITDWRTEEFKKGECPPPHKEYTKEQCCARKPKEYHFKNTAGGYIGGTSWWDCMPAGQAEMLKGKTQKDIDDDCAQEPRGSKGAAVVNEASQGHVEALVAIMCFVPLGLYYT